MTWGEIKRAIEALGISDDDKIAHIDVAFPELSAAQEYSWARKPLRRVPVDGMVGIEQ